MTFLECVAVVTVFAGLVAYLVIALKHSVEPADDD
jgi:hypothetical protein